MTINSFLTPINFIITDPSSGGTFLNWAIHYLAGHEHYFFSETNNWEKLPQNPLTKTNAHNFLPNQIKEYHELSTCIDRLPAMIGGFHSIYFHNLREWPFSNLHKDTQKAANDIIPWANRIIVLTNRPKNSIYFKSFTQRHLLVRSLSDPNKSIRSNQEQLDDYLNLFFKKAILDWKFHHDLNNVWDQRELLALLIPNEATSIAPFIDRSIDHYEIDCLELFNIFDHLLPDLFDYLGVSLDQTRLESWYPIYSEWRKMHYSRLALVWSFDKIIESIINGYYMDLQRFNLDILQEAAIQRELLYKHNLNLKTHQLEKFINTQQLHQLLIPNHHNLNQIELAQTDLDRQLNTTLFDLGS